MRDDESHGRRGLLARSLSSVLWLATSAAGQAIVQLGVVALLSRRIGPEGFGQISLALLASGFARLFVGLGSAQALVQISRLRPDHESTARWICGGTGLLASAALWFAAPGLAGWMGDGQAANLIRAVTPALLVYSFTATSRASLERALQFGVIATATAVGYLVGYVGLGLTLAYAGYGVWALASAVVATQATTSLILWRGVLPSAVRARPSVAAARELLGFGAGMTLTRFLNYVATRGDYLVVGKLLGVGALGLYQRAYRLIEIPSVKIAGVVQEVAFPALASIKSDRDAFSRAYLRITGLIGLVYWPLAAWMIVSADALVEVLYGSAWSDVVIPWRILAVGLTFRASYKINDATIKALGHVYQGALRAMVYAIVVVGAASLGARAGLAGVAAGILVAVLVKYLLTTQLCLKAADIGWGAYLARQISGLTAGALVVALGVATYPVIAGKPAIVRLLGNTLLAGLGLAGLAALRPQLLGPDCPWLVARVRERFTGPASRRS